MCYFALRRWVKSRNATLHSRFTQNSLLSTPQLKDKLSALALEKKNAERRILHLQDKIAHLIEERGIELDCNFEKDMNAVVSKESLEVEKLCPSGSFQRLLWDQQMKALRCKSLRACDGIL